MVDRTPLRKQLWAAWKESIDTEYLSHVINSERGLQAVYYHRLMKHVSENRTVLRLIRLTRTSCDAARRV
jgi:hypothetical protein